MNNSKTKKPSSLFGKLVTDVWRILQLTVALGSLYTMIVHVIHKAYLLFSGAVKDMTMSEVVSSQPVAAPGITIGLPDPIAELIIFCIIMGTLTYIVLKYVCETEWVQERVKIKECWEEVKWYNPFSWFVAIVCTFVEVLKWVLKQICKWIEVIVTVLVIACIAITLIIIFA